MRGFIIEVAVAGEKHPYRVVVDVITDAIASGTRDYVPITEYLAIDENGNAEMVKPRNVKRVIVSYDTEILVSLQGRFEPIQKHLQANK
jgi:hypothetical protein